MLTRINLGAGADLRKGWLNIDANYPVNVPAGVAYLEWDLRHGLPPEVVNVSQVFFSHLNEHLDIDANIKLLRECHRRMIPGGSLFIELPDFVSAIRAYLDKDWEYFRHPAIMHFCRGFNIASLLDYALHQRVNGQPEHISFIDAEYMLYLLNQAGFAQAYQTKFCPGISNPDPLRIKYSIYFEAIK